MLSTEGRDKQQTGIKYLQKAYLVKTVTRINKELLIKIQQSEI